MQPQTFGRYTLLERIAVGGMAEVFRATLQEGEFEKVMCIKRILPYFLQGESSIRDRFVSMFIKEAKLAASLSHQNIVQVFDFGEEDGCLFIAMEYIDGINLKELLHAVEDRGQLFPQSFVILAGIEVARGLHYAHKTTQQRPQGVVHRDISPHNILFANTGAIKVADFGIAKSHLDQSRTATGSIKGKLSYLAPEQARTQVITPAVDQYALGLVLWELMTGQKRFQAPSEAMLYAQILNPTPQSLLQRRKDCHPALAKTIERMLAAKVEERFPDLKQVEHSLRSVLFQLELEEGELDIESYWARFNLNQPRRQTTVSNIDALVEEAKNELAYKTRGSLGLTETRALVSKASDDRNDREEPSSSQIVSDTESISDFREGDLAPNELTASLGQLNTQTVYENDTHRSFISGTGQSLDPELLVETSRIERSEFKSNAQHEDPSSSTRIPIAMGLAFVAIVLSLGFGFALSEDSIDNNVVRHEDESVDSQDEMRAQEKLLADPLASEITKKIARNEPPVQNVKTAEPGQELGLSSGETALKNPDHTPTLPPANTGVAPTAASELQSDTKPKPAHANARGVVAKSNVPKSQLESSHAPEKKRTKATTPKSAGFGIIKLDVNRGFGDIYEGKKKLGTTPGLIRLSSGKHHLRLVNKGAKLDKSIVITIGKDKTISRTVEW